MTFHDLYSIFAFHIVRIVYCMNHYCFLNYTLFFTGNCKIVCPGLVMTHVECIICLGAVSCSLVYNDRQSTNSIYSLLTLFEPIVSAIFVNLVFCLLQLFTTYTDTCKGSISEY